MPTYEYKANSRHSLEALRPPPGEGYYVKIVGVERLNITDDLGNTNTQVNDYFETAIPNVSYTPSDYDGVYSHDLVMPIARQYTIKFRTGIDVVDIGLVRGIGNVSPSYAVRYFDLELPANVECLLTLNPQGMEDLRYDSNGDGTFDTVVPAHVRVAGTAAQDVTAPQVAIAHDGGIGGSGLVTITAADSQSGVRTIYYRIVGSPIFQIYTAPFAVSPRSKITIEAFADDNVGNRSSPVQAVISTLTSGSPTDPLK